jgi:hypothetical protein
MHADGSGDVQSAVTLDGPAVRQLGGYAATIRQVPLADLRAGGWTVSPWKQGSDGSASISFSHPFVDQADLARRLADLVGPNGALRDPVITSRDALSLVVDLRDPSTGIGSDADLQARLRAAGIDPKAIDASLRAQLRGMLHLTVVIRTPDGHRHTVAATSGSAVTFRAVQSRTDYDRMSKLGIAAALALLAGLFLLAAGASARREKRRRTARVRLGIEHERVPLM